MGGMHAWLWGEQYPALMDAIIPVACQPDANSIDSPELGVIRKGVDGVNSFSHWPIITERFQWRLRAGALSVRAKLHQERRHYSPSPEAPQSWPRMLSPQSPRFR
jgi:hypothetical protein